MLSILPGLLTAIITPLVLWWLARKYPARRIDPEGPSLIDLRRRYWKWDIVFAITSLLLWVFFTVFFFVPLHFVAEWRAEALRDDPSTFVFYADGISLVLPALFMAFVPLAYLLLVLERFILKERYLEYERYTTLQFGFDQDRVLKLFATGVTAVSITLVWMLFDTYVVASSNEFRFNTFLGGDRRYRYNGISLIATAPALIASSGKTVYRRVHVVKFKDGTFFSTDSIPDHEIAGRTNAALIEAIVGRSGVQPIERSQFERGERWGEGL